MPRRLTRPEVARRLAIRATRDARPKLTIDDLCGLFAASRRTVRDAMRRTVPEWVGILAAAPLPRGRVAVGVPKAAPRPGHAQVPRRRASRAGARLVPPERMPEAEEPPSDVEAPEPVEVPEQNPDVDLPEPADPRDPMDDPVPRARRRRG